MLYVGQIGGDDMLASISQAAKELSVSTEHLRRMIRAGSWPVYKLGPKATRIDVDEIKKLMRVDSVETKRMDR